VNHVTSLAATIAGIVAGLTALGWLVQKAWRGIRSVGYLLDDLRGEPARPGVPARPGIMDRLAAVESDMARVRAEVTPNGGGSMKDSVGRIEASLREHDALLRGRPPTP
jgi:hypothetical protein